MRFTAAFIAAFTAPLYFASPSVFAQSCSTSSAGAQPGDSAATPSVVVGSRLSGPSTSITLSAQMLSVVSYTGPSGKAPPSAYITPTFPDEGREGYPGPCNGAAPVAGGVVIRTGTSVIQEHDFTSAGEAPLELTRTYSSAGYWRGIFGLNWSSSYDRSLGFHLGDLVNGQECQSAPGNPVSCSFEPPQPVRRVYVRSPSGGQRTYTWDSALQVWRDRKTKSVAWMVQDPQTGNWTHHTDNNDIETYNEMGFVLSVKDEFGVGWSFSYGAGYYLQSVTHSSGRSVQFSWTNGRLTRVTNPDGKFIDYTYGGNGALASATYPANVGVTRTYYYADGRFPWAITSTAVNAATYRTYAYDANGRVSSSSLGNGVESYTFTYSTDGTYTDVTNAAAAVSRFSYTTASGSKVNSAIQLSGFLGCANAAATTQYDANGYPRAQTDWNGNTTILTYNDKGQLQAIATGLTGTAPNYDTTQQRITNYVWDDAHNRIASVLTYGATTAQPVSRKDLGYYLDGDPAAGRIASVKVYNKTSFGVPNQLQTTTYSYAINSSTRIPTQVSSVGPGGQVTTAYNTTGDLVSASDGVNPPTTFTGHNGLGLPASVSDRNAFAMNYGYDALGRVTSSNRTLEGTSATTTYSFSSLGLPQQTTYADGGYVSNAYDSAGRRVSIATDLCCGANANGTTVWENYKQFQYNALSRQTHENITKYTTKYIDGVPQSSQATPYLHDWTYDNRGRLQTDRGQHGQVTTYTYDANGNIQTRTDSLNHVWTYTYDSHNQVKTIVGPAPSSTLTSYEYDDAGNVNRITDPKFNSTSYSYDGFGNLVQLSSPDTGSTSYVFDSLGRKTQMTRNDQNITTYQNYDLLNRVGLIQAGSQSVSYTYDSCTNGRGHVCSITDSSGSTAYTYRQNGQVASQTSTISGVGYTTSWTYDNRDRVQSMTYPSNSQAVGNKVTYAYDTQSHVTGVTVSLNGGTPVNVATNFGYSGLGFGPRTNMTLGDNGTLTWTYDTDYRLTGTAAGSLVSFNYGFDPANRLTSLTNNLTTSKSETLAYDELDRLTAVTSAGLGNQGWTFDSNGNRNTHNWGGATDTYQPESSSNFTPAILGPRARTFTRDTYHLGNIVASSSAGGNQQYTFDPLNRMGGVAVGLASTTYTYNAMNQRVRKSGPDGTYNFVYDPNGTLLGETSNGTSALTSQYLWLEGRPLALIRNGLLYFVRTDHLGRPEVVTDAAGVRKWQADNFVYDRKVILPTGPNTFRFNLGFPGQYFDNETGLWYNLNRYYDPGTGRYLASDPIGLSGGLGTYSYVSNNPILRIDPLGLDWFRPDDHPYTVGRDDTILPPGPDGIGGYGDDYLPAGHTFGSMHDRFVGFMDRYVPDAIINVPSMPVVFVIAFIRETLASLLDLFGIHVLDHKEPEDETAPTPTAEPSKC